MSKENNEKRICPNCEQAFDRSFAYCPHCGQQNKKLDLHLRYFLNDFISSSFNLDSKIFRTLKLLIFYPGKLSREFIAGKRTRYIPPVRLYLIISLVYFTLLSLLDAEVVNIKDTGEDAAAADTVEARSENSAMSLADSMGIAELTLADTALQFRSKSPGFEYQITSENKMKRQDPIAGKDSSEVIITLNNLDDLNKLLEAQTDTLNKEEKSAWRKFMMPRLRKLSTKEGKKEFQALIRKYVSIGMFILMPLTAWIFYLLFYRNTYYISHLVFVLHLQSMMYILFIIMNLIQLVIDNSLIDILNAGLFLFILTTWIRHFYQIGWWKTVWKAILFLCFYGISFLIFLAVIGAVSAVNL